jgi:hypothetical protein
MESFDMTQEDIIRMAREAGLELARFTIIDGSNKLKRFAALVAAAERERIIAANIPEIEKTNAYIKMLQDVIAVLRARGNT